MRIGKDNVIMGQVSENLAAGDGNVIIGSTDSNGNVILNSPMAIGRDAKAGPGTIAIGAGAGASTQTNTAAPLINSIFKFEISDLLGIKKIFY